MSGNKIERRKWQCPLCERRYNIPVSAKAPLTCPRCSDPSTRQRGGAQRADTEEDRRAREFNKKAYWIGALCLLFAIPMSIRACNNNYRNKVESDINDMFTQSSESLDASRGTLRDIVSDSNRRFSEQQQTTAPADDPSLDGRRQQPRRTDSSNKWPVAFQNLTDLRQAGPEREYLQGLTSRYRSDGTGKANGIKFTFSYPNSWSSKPGSQPHVVNTFLSGTNGEVVTLSVFENPTESRRANGEFDVDSALQLAVRTMKITTPNFGQVDSGQLLVAGRQTGWLEFTVKNSIRGVDLNSHGCVFMIFHRDQRLHVLFGAVSTESEGRAKERFQHNARLFRLMLDGLDLQD